MKDILRVAKDAGLVDSDELSAVLDNLPADHDSAKSESVARLLLKSKKLTSYQARVISRGKGHLLLMKNYLIMEKIGKGGMGTVFRAKHLTMKRDVAMKVLTRDHKSDPRVTQRFFREIRAAGMLCHPNIASAFDADIDHGHWFLVSEFVNGEDLGCLVESEGKLTVATTIDIILQTAMGLECAHESGVVHRDIKPANLMLDQLGKVKILDLGLAQLHSERDQLKLTYSGKILGTPHYMAPEQATSSRTVDERSDIYSLGCTLYYLLTASPMYESDTLMGVLMAHENQPIPALNDKVDGVNDMLQAVFEKMVAKRPQDRYQRMAHVVEELQSLKDGKKKAKHVLPYSGVSNESDIKRFLEMLEQHPGSGNDSPGEYFLDDSQGSIPTRGVASMQVSTLIDTVAARSDSRDSKHGVTDRSSTVRPAGGTKVILIVVICFAIIFAALQLF